MTDKVQKISKVFTRLKKMLDDALSKETKESWNERLDKEEPISDDLEKAARHYLYSNILYDDVYVGNPTDKDCIEMFKAGANWQKEQMMAKAVDGIAMPNDGEIWLDCIFDLAPYNEGEEVKVIIIKECRI